MDTIQMIDERIGQLRIEWNLKKSNGINYRINELQRLREQFLLTTEKENPCYQKSPSLRIATTLPT